MKRLKLTWGIALMAAACTAPENKQPPGNERLGTTEDALSVCPPVTVEGLDVSAGDGTIDWNMVKGSGRKFAIIKATQGDYYTSNQFDTQRSGAKAAGLLVSPYHFFDGTIDGVAQAKHFLQIVGPLGPGDLPPMLDIECPTSSNQSATQSNCEYTGNSGWVDAATLNQRIHDWLSYVEQQTGRVPLIYSYNYWFNDSGCNSSTLHQYPLVISSPSSGNCYTVGVGNDFMSAAFWQWSTSGSCPGVGGQVDLDRFNGTLGDLEILAGLGSLSQVSGNDAMTLVNWSTDGHPELFVKTKDGQMLHTYPSGSGDTWTAPVALDGSSQCGAAAGFWPAQAYAELFDPGADGGIQHLFWKANAWNTWQADLAGMPPAKLSHASTLVWPDGHMEVFALGDDGAIWHTHLAIGVDPGWAAWQSLGGKVATGAAPIMWNDGHAEIFATDASGAAWHAWSGSGAGFTNGWHAFESLGGALASRPVPVRWGDGHVEIFGTGLDGQLHHSAHSAMGWGMFDVLSPGTIIAGEPGAIVNPPGNGAIEGPEIFARSKDGKVLHLWWDGAKWTAFTPHLDQATSSDPFAWIRADGSAEVFTIDTSGVLTRSYHNPKTGWQPWAPIGGMNLDTCLTAATNPSSGAGATGSTGTGSGSGAGSATGSGGGSAGPLSKGTCSCRVVGGDDAPFGAVALGALGVALARRRSNRSQ